MLKASLDSKQNPIVFVEEMSCGSLVSWPMLSNDTDGWRRPNNDTTYFERRRNNFTPEYCDITDTARNYNDFYLYSTAYVTPLICLIGLVGNCLNLGVFSVRCMRTKTNGFLAAMALADALFFVALYPTTLDAYESLRQSEN